METAWLALVLPLSGRVPAVPWGTDTPTQGFWGMHPESATGARRVEYGPQKNVSTACSAWSLIARAAPSRAVSGPSGAWCLIPHSSSRCSPLAGDCCLERPSFQLDKQSWNLASHPDLLQGHGPAGWLGVSLFPSARCSLSAEQRGSCWLRKGPETVFGGSSVPQGVGGPDSGQSAMPYSFTHRHLHISPRLTVDPILWLRTLSPGSHRCEWVGHARNPETSSSRAQAPSTWLRSPLTSGVPGALALEKHFKRPPFCPTLPGLWGDLRQNKEASPKRSRRARPQVGSLARTPYQAPAQPLCGS